MYNVEKYIPILLIIVALSPAMAINKVIAVDENHKFILIDCSLIFNFFILSITLFDLFAIVKIFNL